MIDDLMSQPDSLLFQVSPTSGVPIYRQMMTQIEQLILSGQLKENDPLPSVRDLAKQLEVNPMTVSKAYSLMEAAGWLSRLRGKGMIVAPLRSMPRTPGSSDDVLRPAITELLRQADQLGISHQSVLTLLKTMIKERQ